MAHANRIAAAMLLACGAALGQYDPGAWPAQTHQRELPQQVLDVMGASVEVYRGAWAANDRYLPPYDPLAAFATDPAGWPDDQDKFRELHTKVTAMKAALYRNCNSYVDPSGITNFLAWMNANATNPVAWDAAPDSTNCPLPFFTPITLAQYARVPTNVWAWTPSPYRGLNGTGPFTNDATVAYPHGWTNALTAAGGTNYPAGRSTWYTTDYGLPAVTSLLAACRYTVNLRTWTISDGGTYQSAAGGTWRTETAATNEYSGYGSSTQTWASAEHIADTNFPVGVVERREVPRAMSLGWVQAPAGTTNYYAQYDTVWSQWQMEVGSGTNWNAPEFTAYLYLFNDSTEPNDLVGETFETVTFDANGDNVAADAWVIHTAGVFTVSTTNLYAYVYSSEYPRTNRPQPATCATPTLGDDQLRGWNLGFSYRTMSTPANKHNFVLPLMDWRSTTNGFKYQ